MVVDSGITVGLGRVTVATRDFCIGDTVLAEPPSLVFDTAQGYVALWNAYLNADEEKQKGIMDMHHTPETNVTRQQMVTSHFTRFQAQEHRLSEEEARKLVSIVNGNAHAYSIAKTGSLVVTPQTASGETALYAIGSKIEHSCAPSLTFSTSDLGLLQFFADEPIAKDERLTCSYAPTVYQMPRKERREFLQENKQFHCNCQRCLGPDDCSPLKCAECGKGALFQGGDGLWSCSSCSWNGSTSQSIRRQMQEQDSVDASLEGIKRLMEEGSISPDILKDCKDLEARVYEKFHPLHWLYAKVWEILTSMAASVARMNLLEGLPPTHMRTQALLAESSLAQLKHAIWLRQISSIVHGVSELQDVARDLEWGSQISSTATLDGTLDALISDDQPLREKAAVVQLIFQAGLDLLLAGYNNKVASLYRRYQPLFARWESLSEDNRSKINILVESEGRENRFPNHLLL
jgi:Zn-finger protein